MKDFFKCHLCVLKALKLFRKIKKLEYFGGVRYLVVLTVRPGPQQPSPLSGCSVYKLTFSPRHHRAGQIQLQQR